MLAAHRELLATELNVKSVELLATEPQRDLVLDSAKLGRRLRDKVKRVAAAVAAGAYAECDGGSVDVAGACLTAGEFSWRARPSSERGHASRDGLAVVLDLVPRRAPD